MKTAAAPAGLALFTDILNHLFLPFFVLTVSYLAEYSLIMRSSLMEVLDEDFIIDGPSQGMREERCVRARRAHALLPTMTITILSLGSSLGRPS